MSHRSNIGVVMLTWNQKDMTIEGLSSLRKLEAPQPRIILVDNGSRDGTISTVSKDFPEVEIISLPENIGFCAANNRGTERLLQDPHVEYIIYLNNDIEISPNCIRILHEFMETHPKAGACGPLVFYHEAPEVIWAAGGRIFTDLMWFPPIMRGKKNPGLRRPQKVDYVHGCALMVRRSVIESIGVFDERYFIYHDEVDWCLRMKNSGFEVWMVPSAHLFHKVTQAVGFHSPMMIYYTSRNKLLIWWKFGRFSDLWKFYAFHLLKFLRIFARSGSWWSIVSLAKAMIDAIFGGFGRGHIEKARKP